MATFRTHNNADLNPQLAGSPVKICGWVHKIRDHGGVYFMDLRDRSGLCQVLLPDGGEEGLKLRADFVVSVEGKVVERPDGMKNSKIPSGEIEVHAEKIELLSEAEVPPFQVTDEDSKVQENTRLKYRYLELRRPALQDKLRRRHEVLQETRKYFSEEGFLEIETPILYKSTPEGARDYLVPSRVHPNSFYALPQSPQTLKQLLMIGGIERYCQIARCFRDEDLRADRQPEFTQIDIEASFIDQEELMGIIERFVQRLWKNVLNIDIPLGFQRITYADAMRRFGSDRPDLRYKMELENLSDWAKKSSFKIFSQTVNSGGAVYGLPLKSSEFSEQNLEKPEFSRKKIEKLGKVVESFGLKGLAWIKVEAEGWGGSIAKFFDSPLQKELGQQLQLEPGDFVFFAAEEESRVQQALGALRSHLALELGFVRTGMSKAWPFAWVTDFPLFEFDSKNNRYVPAHHPFTQPDDEAAEILKSGNYEAADLAKMKAKAYDLALNGHEIAGGSLRIHNSSLQKALFQAIGIQEAEAEEKFGFFMEALKYGTPPHGGIAFGFDRLLMLMCGTEAIRDVIAFPKTTSAMCLMSEAPSSVDPEQLAELRIRSIRSEV